jgi:hypothetical protein
VVAVGVGGKDLGYGCWGYTGNYCLVNNNKE